MAHLPYEQNSLAKALVSVAISLFSVRVDYFPGYLDQVIDQPDYCLQKAKLLSEKKSLEEEISTFSHKQNDWLAPFQNWLKDAQSLDKIASDSDLFAKKVCAKEIFGSHLLLGEKTLRACAPEILNSLAIPPKNPWSALCAVRLYPPKKSLSSLLVGKLLGFQNLQSTLMIYR